VNPLGGVSVCRAVGPVQSDLLVFQSARARGLTFLSAGDALTLTRS